MSAGQVVRVRACGTLAVVAAVNPFGAVYVVSADGPDVVTGPFRAADLERA